MELKNLNTAAQALSELDFSNEIEQLAEFDGKVAEFHEAIGRADDRRMEINRALSETRRADPTAVADALLADTATATVVAASPSRESLEAEREGLAEGTRELRNRVDDARSDANKIRLAAACQVYDAAAPLVSDIHAEVQSTLELLLPQFAALVAIIEAKGAGRGVTEKLRAIIEVAQNEGLLPRRAMLDVPAEIIDALAPLADKAAVLDARLISTTSMP